MPPFKIQLPHLTGTVDYHVEQAFNQLRQGIEDGLNGIQGQLDGLPAPLTLPQIQQALSPTGAFPLPTASLLNTTPAQSNPVPPPPTPVDDGIPDHGDIVAAVYAAHPVGPSSTDEEMFRFCQYVAQAILAAASDPPGLTCGLLLKPTGANIYTCNGLTYSYSRVCYSNGHVFKIVVDADPGGARTPEWTDNSPPLLPADYSVATDPSSPCA